MLCWLPWRALLKRPSLPLNQILTILSSDRMKTNSEWSLTSTFYTQKKKGRHDNQGWSSSLIAQALQTCDKTEFTKRSNDTHISRISSVNYSFHKIRFTISFSTFLSSGIVQHNTGKIMQLLVIVSAMCSFGRHFRYTFFRWNRC